MGLSVASGQITSPTSTGNAATTGVGFQPKLLILFATLATDTAACAPNIGMGTSSSAQWSQSFYQSTTNLGRRLTNTNIFDNFYASSGVATTFLMADLVSLDSDGFTLHWSTVDASGYPIEYLAIGGTDFSASVGVQSTGTGTGNESITGLAFTPKAVQMFGACATSSLNSADINATATGIGVAVSSSAQWTWAGASDNANAASAVFKTNKVWSSIVAAGTVFMEADFVSMDASGLTYNITTGGFALSIPYVAFGGTAQYAVGNFGSPTSTGNQSITGVGFTPSVDLFASAGKTASNTATSDVYVSYGAGISSSSRRTITGTIINGTSATSRGYLGNAPMVIRDATTANLLGTDMVSQDADGFTTNFFTVQASAYTVGYLAIGAAPPPSRFLLVRN